MAQTKNKPTVTETTQPIEEVEVNHIDPNELLNALYFFWDAFERSTLDFFLIRDTAKQVIAGSDLSGDKITLGLRKLEWKGGQSNIFKAFMEHENMKPVETGTNYLVFSYKGVPVYVYLFDENPCIQTLDIVFYHNETFNVPNNLPEFKEKYDH